MLEVKLSELVAAITQMDSAKSVSNKFTKKNFATNKL